MGFWTKSDRTRASNTGPSPSAAQNRRWSLRSNIVTNPPSPTEAELKWSMFRQPLVTDNAWADEQMQKTAKKERAAYLAGGFFDGSSEGDRARRRLCLAREIEARGGRVDGHVSAVIESLTREATRPMLNRCLGSSHVEASIEKGATFHFKSEPEDPSHVARVCSYMAGSMDCSEAEVASILDAFGGLISFPSSSDLLGTPVGGWWFQPSDEVVDRVLRTLRAAARKLAADRDEAERRAIAAADEAEQRRLDAERNRRQAAEAAERNRREAAEAAERARREAERRRAEADLAQRQRDREETGASIVRNAEQSVSDFSEMPVLLARAKAAEAESRHFYEDGAFSPFWSSIERAYATLAEYAVTARRLTQRAAEHVRLVGRLCDLGGDPTGIDKFPVAFDLQQSQANLEEAAKTFGDLVYEAQKQPVFAQIWEQRRTTAAVESGFLTLEGAVSGMSRQVAQALDGLSSQIAASERLVYEAIANRGQSSGDATESQVAAMRELVYSSDQIRKALAQQTWGSPWHHQM